MGNADPRMILHDYNLIANKLRQDAQTFVFGSMGKVDRDAIAAITQLFNYGITPKEAKESQEEHFAERLFERYNITFSTELRQEFLRQIHDGEALTPDYASPRIGRFKLLVCWNEKPVLIIYDETVDKLITALPMPIDCRNLNFSFLAENIKKKF